jgi:hypothetical protein
VHRTPCERLDGQHLVKERTELGGTGRYSASFLHFRAGETPWPGPPAFAGTIYFHLESVDGLLEEIKEHTTPAWGPADREWSTRELGRQDPNGYFLTFTQPV